MFGESGTLPLAGGVLSAILLYAGVSLFVTGPLVGERMVAKMDWPALCEGHIRAEVEADRPVKTAIPNFGCDEMIGMWFGAEGDRFCARHSEVFANNPINKTLQATEDAKREAQRRRMDYAASRAGSRCECAVTTTLENRRVTLALYVGTARLITPPSVKLIGSDLVASLNSPACAMKE